MVDDSGLPAPKKMLRLTVIVKARDSFEGKPLVDVLLSLYKQAGISGATVTHAARGYGARGVARADVLGLSVNLPTIVETVADFEKIGKVIPEIHRMVGSNGLVTTAEVNVY
jgi:PII-like signaling protein